MTSNAVDICFSFDMTLSMTPSIYQVRVELDRLLDKLSLELQDLKVAIITHGDYDSSNYLTRHLDFTSDIKAIREFILKVDTAGINSWNDGEAYEEVLYLAKTLNWRKDAKRALVVIGDDIPHLPTYRHNTKGLDWRKELTDLWNMEISTYGLQSPTLDTNRSKFFYSELVKNSLNNCIIPLNQFSYIVDIMISFVYKQYGSEKLEEFENTMRNENRYNRNMEIVMNNLLNRDDKNEMSFVNNTINSDVSAADLTEISATRFQVLTVMVDKSIKDFVNETGAIFKAGKGFYELTKAESVSPKKEIILQHINSGIFYSGRQARSLLGLDTINTKKIKPSDIPDGYITFIQSTSYNRKLIGNTKFLYDIS